MQKKLSLLFKALFKGIMGLLVMMLLLLDCLDVL